jgi:signal transduction histidine kinase
MAYGQRQLINEMFGRRWPRVGWHVLAGYAASIMVRTNLRVFRVGQGAAVLTLALLGLLDLAGGLVSGAGFGKPLGVAEVVSAVAAAAVFVPAHRQATRALPLAAIAVGAYAGLLTAAEAATWTYTRSWGLAETAALLGVLLVTVRRGTPRLAVAAGVVVAGAIVTQPLANVGVLGSVTDTTVILMLLLTLFAVAAAVAGGFLRFADLNRLRQLAALRAEQRTEFARDLHDFVAHHVTGMVVLAQGAQHITEREPAPGVRTLEQIESAGVETMAAMRGMVGMLREPVGTRTDAARPMAPVAGIADVAPLVERFTAAGGPTARLVVDGTVDGLPVEVTSSAYRVVMEALTNVRRHAATATVVDVSISRSEQRLLVRVADDGRHAPGSRAVRSQPGFGLIGLAERLATIGGRVPAGPGSDGGWVVEASLAQPAGATAP